MIPESFIRQVVGASDIESLASGYVRLKRSGRTLSGLCPFHGEKTPSFHLYPESNSFYCFGCGAGGDVITFIKQIEHLDYVEAVKFLADRAGLRMPEDAQDDAVAKLRLRVLEANREAARLFHSWLYSPQGAEGLAYWRRRGLSEATIKRFGLGYAPDSFGALRDALKGKGFREDELVAAGLCRTGRNNGVYDFFRGRVMVPIIDLRGSVIGFGGRVLDDTKPKYINTAETPVFQKSRELFALNFAKAKAARPDGVKQLLLCEGYMDVIAMHQAGFENAVAALGTSYTKDHALLIARYAEEAVLLFDADAAGQKGTLRALHASRDNGLRVRVVRIPEGKDPDDYIRNQGADRLRLLIDKAAGDVDYRLGTLRARFNLEEAAGKVQFLNEAVELLATLTNTLEQEVYAGRLAQELDVSRAMVLEQVRHAVARKAKREAPRALAKEVARQESGRVQVNAEAARHPRAARAEEALLGLLLRDPSLIPAVADKLLPNQMVTAFNRGVYALLTARAKAGLVVELALLAADYGEAEMGYLARMLRDAGEGDASPEEAARYAEVILREGALQVDADASNEELLGLLERLKQEKA